MTLIPVHGLLSVFAESATLERPGTQTVNGLGEVVDGAATSTAITVMTHPLPGEDVERLKLDRKHSYRVFDSNTEFELGGDEASPDVIVYDGQRWELQQVEDYQTHGGLTGSVGRLIE